MNHKYIAFIFTIVSLLIFGIIIFLWKIKKKETFLINNTKTKGTSIVSIDNIASNRHPFVMSHTTNMHNVDSPVGAYVSLGTDLGNN